MKYEIKKEKNSKVELEVTYTATEYMALWDKAFKVTQADIEMSGFRKGNAPQSAIVAKYGETAILSEMSNIAINESYPKIIIEEKIKVISDPHIHVVSMEKDKDFTYHAHVSVYPEVKMPKYMSIASDVVKKEKREIPNTTDEEVNKVLEQVDEKVKSETENIENKIKENMKLEKELMEKSRVRSIILESLIKEIEGNDTIKASELWPEGFTDKDKAQIIVMEIAKIEKLEATSEEVETEVMKIMMHMNPKDINESNLDETRIKSYAEQIIINEKVLSVLEK